MPLTTEYSAPHTQTCAPFNDLFALAYQSGSAGYCFADPMDHMPTTAIPDEATRKALAGEGGCAEQQHGGGEHEGGRELAGVRDGA